jgi:hypothetical protein
MDSVALAFGRSGSLLACLVFLERIWNCALGYRDHFLGSIAEPFPRFRALDHFRVSLHASIITSRQIFSKLMHELSSDGNAV